MRRISYLAVLAVAAAAVGVTAYAQTTGSILEFESAVLDGTTGELVISFDSDIDLLAIDGAKLHIRERGESSGGVSLDGVVLGRERITYEFSSVVGRTGSGDTQFNEPNDILVNSTGHIFVADTKNHRIQIFSPNGEVTSLGKTDNGNPVSGTENGTFNEPYGIAIDSKNRLIVTESGNNRVQILHQNGTHIHTIGNPDQLAGIGKYEFDQPRHIDVDSVDRIIVADRQNSDESNTRIQIFNSDGTFVTSLNNTGLPGTFDFVFGIAVDSRDRILATNFDNGKLLIFDSEGKLIGIFGDGSSGPGGLNNPRGLATDSRDRIFIADSVNNRVHMFDSEGRHAGTIGSGGTGGGQFDRSSGVAFDSDDRMYVTEYSDRVHTFVPALARLSFALDSDTLGRIKNMDDPVLDIEAGAVRTAVGAPVAESTGNHLAVRGEPPGFELANLNRFTGDLSIYFDEPINPLDTVPSGLHIRDANRTGNDMTLTADFTLIDDRYDFGSYFATNVTHGIRAPSDMAVASDGSIIVADSENHCIRIFEPDGTIKEIGKDNTCGPDSDGDADGQFNGTRGVAVNSTGHIFVADTDNHRIQILNSSGDYVHKFGTRGAGDEQFRNPMGITIDSTGRILVADTENDRMVIYNPDYSFDRKFGEVGARHHWFRTPTAVAVNSTDHIFVADTDNHRINMFNSTGGDIGVIGTQITFLINPSSDNGKFNSPTGIEIDSNDRLIISDTGNNRVQILDSDTSYITQFGSRGSGDGNFTSPRGVAVHGDDILVADTGNNRIQRFVPGTDDTSRHVIDVEVQLRESIGSRGAANGTFYEPSAVAIDRTGRIIVADSANHRVQIFNPDGTHEETIGKPDGSSGTGNREFDFPRGVAVNSTDHIFVADTNNDRIHVLDRYGTPVSNITAVFTTSDLNKPHGIMINDTNHIFVADRNENRVVIYYPNGTYMDALHYAPVTANPFFDGSKTPEDVAEGAGIIAVADNENNRIRIFNSTDLSHVNTFGTPGDGDGDELDTPRGVAIDEAGRIWVADTDNHRIKIFNPDGTLVYTFGSEGTDGLGFSSPRGITIDKGLVWIADTGNHRVKAFAFVSDAVSFNLVPQAVHAVTTMDIPVLDIAEGAVTDPEGDIVTASTGNTLMIDATLVLSSVRVVPASGTIGYGGSLYIEFESEPGLSIHPDSTINDRPVGTDALSYFDGTYSIRYTVSENDNNATAGSLPISVTILDKARNEVSIDGTDVGSTPAINSALPATFELLDSSFRLDTSAITLRFNANVSVSDVLTLQIRDTDGTELNLLSDGVELSLPDDSDYTLTRTINSDDITGSMFNEPSDIAINSTGHMFVADAGNHRILVFDPDGNYLRHLGNDGTGNDNIGRFSNEFQWPRGIAVNGTDYIFVAEIFNHRIQILYPNGSFAGEIRGIQEPSGNIRTDPNLGHFDRPTDVAIDSTGRILVAEIVNRRVQIFDLDGPGRIKVDESRGIRILDSDKNPFSIPPRHTPQLFGTGQDSGPQGVTADNMNRIFAADTDNARILIFSPDGSSESMFGERGTGEGNFTSPRGMAVDDSGRIWVAEAGANDRLQLVTPDGDHVMYLGVDELTNPRGVAYDRYRVFAADTGGDRVLVYEPLVSEFRFALSGEAREIVSRMVSPSVHVDVTVSNPDGLALKERYVVAGYVPAPDDTDSRVTVDVAVPELQDRSTVHRPGGGGSSTIISGTPILPSPGEATSVLHSINWETSNDMITLYVVTSAPAGSEPYVYLRTPDSGTITAKVSDSQPYPGRILYEAEISASNNFAQVYVDDVSQYILLDAPKGNVPVTLYDDPDTSLVEPAMDPVITKPAPVIEPETPEAPEPVEPVIKNDIQDPIQDVEPVQDAEPIQVAVDPEPTDNEQIPDDNINGCLIATAAYGTELAPQVQLLREIRDGSLLQTDSGTAFMGAFNNIYYAFSPAVSDLQRENPVFREATKLLLTPMLYTLNIMSIADDEASVLGLGLSVIALNIGMYIISPAFAGYTVYKRRKN